MNEEERLREDMRRFVDDTQKQFSANKKSEDLNATRTPATPTSRISPARRSNLNSAQQTQKKTVQSSASTRNQTVTSQGYDTMEVSLCKGNEPTTVFILVKKESA
jgi:hypothetical protein